MSEVEKQKEIEEVIQGLASATQEIIKDLFGEMGFAILVFEFNRFRSPRDARKQSVTLNGFI